MRTIVSISSQLCVQCHHVGRLKLATVGIPICQKWANAMNEPLFSSLREPVVTHLPVHHCPGGHLHEKRDRQGPTHSC